MNIHSVSGSQKPLLVVMSGAPGSGKSTLARLLAKHLGLYHFERDIFRLGVEYASGIVQDRATRAKTVTPIYYGCIAHMLSVGVSLVGDGTLARGKSEEQVLELCRLATVVSVHTEAKDPLGRFRARELAKKDKDRAEWLIGFEPKLIEVISSTREPLNLPCPVLRVTTNGEYNPTIDKIAAWVTANYTA